MAREGKVSGLNAASHYDAAMSVFPWYERAIYALAMAVSGRFPSSCGAGAWTPPLKLLERVEGSTGSVVICNHTSMAEVVALVPYLWARGHRVRPIFKSEFESRSASPDGPSHSRAASPSSAAKPTWRCCGRRSTRFSAARTCSSSPRAPASAPMTSPSRSTAASRSSRRWARPGSCLWPYAGFAM